MEEEDLEIGIPQRLISACGNRAEVSNGRLASRLYSRLLNLSLSKLRGARPGSQVTSHFSAEV